MPEMGGLEATAAIRARERDDRRPHSDHCVDRARHVRRSRAVPGGRHGRVRLEAAPAAGSVLGDRPASLRLGRPRRRNARRPLNPHERWTGPRCWRASAGRPRLSPTSWPSFFPTRRPCWNGCVPPCGRRRGRSRRGRPCHQGRRGLFSKGQAFESAGGWSSAPAPEMCRRSTPPAPSWRCRDRADRRVARPAFKSRDPDEEAASDC